MPIDQIYESWRSLLPLYPEEVYIEALKNVQNHYRKLRKSKNIVDIEFAQERLEKAKSVFDQIKKYRRAQLDYQKKLLPQELICDVFQNLDVKEVDKCRSVNLWWNNTVLANDYVLPRKWTKIPIKEEVPIKEKIPTKNRTRFEDDFSSLLSLELSSYAAFLVPQNYINWNPFILRMHRILSPARTIKIADFGLARTIKGEEYARKPIQVNPIQQLIQSNSEETWEFPKKLKKNGVYKNEKPSYKVAQKKVYCQINQPRTRSNRFN